MYEEHDKFVSVQKSLALETERNEMLSSELSACHESTPKVYEGIELARKEGVDFMLPVGGGSVIDTAKAIAAGVPYEGDFWVSRIRSVSYTHLDVYKRQSFTNCSLAEENRLVSGERS